MSRYKFTTPAHTVVIGWDNPLQTFFAQVWPGHSDRNREEPLLWVGCFAGQITTIDALAEVLEPFAEIPDDVAARLGVDYDQRIPSGSSFPEILTLGGHNKRGR
jgi:hypothetical protein